MRGVQSIMVSIAFSSCAATALRDGSDTEPRAPETARTVGSDQVIRVVLGPQRPLRPGVGFRVRAENPAGTIIERTTVPNGTALLPLDPSAGPWDLTVARAGCAAVSLMDITRPIDGEIYTECNRPPGEPMFHTLRIGVSGIADLSMGPGVFPTGFLGASELDRLTATFEYHSGAPPIDVWAVRFVTAHGLSHPTNVARTVFSLPDGDATVTVSLPSPPVPVIRSTVHVQFPSEGILTARAGQPNGEVSVTRWMTGLQGAPETYPVGLGIWSPPDSTGLATWQFETFAPPFEPDTATVGISDNSASSMISGTLHTHAFSDGATVVVPPVFALSLDDSVANHPRIVAEAPAFTHAVFIAQPAAPNVHGWWRGFSASGNASGSRRVPRLPSGVTLSDLTFGLSQSDHFQLAACIERVGAGARPPWTPDSHPDILLCAHHVTRISDP